MLKALKRSRKKSQSLKNKAWRNMGEAPYVFTFVECPVCFFVRFVIDFIRFFD